MPFNSICRVLASLIWNRDLVEQGIPCVVLKGIDPWVRMIINWDGRVPVTKAMQTELYKYHTCHILAKAGMESAYGDSG